jgi:uncharacterized protein YgbK (DUF1537 family)
VRRAKAAVFAGIPPEQPHDFMGEIHARLEHDPRQLIVLDDDPTGTQTVYSVPVLTEWSVEMLRKEMQRDHAALYILTNSRSLPQQQAVALAQEIGRNLIEAANLTQRPIAVVSRSDSTLRGHFPAEVDALADALNTPFDGLIILPFFSEGGRFTIGNIHYVEQNGELVPAAETAYAQDPVFGYRSSDLREWIAEKTMGRVPPDDVAVVSLDDLRCEQPIGSRRVYEILGQLENGRVCVVNAASYHDVEVFVAGLLAAEAEGKRFLYRTAASFVRVRAGLSAHPLLKANDIGLDTKGGTLTVVGSYVPTTTAQLQHVLTHAPVEAIEVECSALLNSVARQSEIRRVVRLAESALQKNKDTVIYTSRTLIQTDMPDESLLIGSAISQGLVEIVQQIRTRPRWLIAKGGITSSDIAKFGIGIHRAQVLGQVLPGVPVWRAGDESHFPGMPVVIFPGNVGNVDALTHLLTVTSHDVDRDQHA